MSSSTPRSNESPISPSQRATLASHNSFSSYDSTVRPGPHRQYASRRSSTASSTASLAGPSDGIPPNRRNSLKEIGSNAISTLLQQPIVRTGLTPHSTGPSAPKPPSAKDIPPVTLTTIPKADHSLFEKYLRQAGTLYDVFRRSKEGGDEGRSSHSRKESEELAGMGLGHGMQRRLSGTHSLRRTESSLSIAEGTPHLRRRSSGGNVRRPGLAAVPLSTIPIVYFEEDFRLENPRTFDIVSEKSEIARPPGANGLASAAGSSGRKALAANAILQEKLSWYMDTVEIHLISSISTASTSFFAALGSLRELHSEATDSVGKIKALRQDLISLDQGMAIGGLKVVEKRRRRTNMRRLGDAVQQLEKVVRSVSYCEEQVDRGEVEEALGGLVNVERLIAGESIDASDIASQKSPVSKDSLIDLRGIKALSGATNDIAFLRKRIGKAFEVKFVDTLLHDLRRHADNVPANSTFQRWDNASSRLRGQHTRKPSEFPTFLHVDGEFRSLLLSHVKGLARSDSIMSAALAYKEAILREFKNLIRRHLPSSNEDDVESTTSIATHDSRSISSQEKSSILARNLRSLDADDAEEMFKKIYSNVGEALRRLGTQVKVLLDITSSLDAPSPSIVRSPPRSPRVGSIDSVAAPAQSPGPSTSLPKQEEIQQILDLSSLLGQAVDIAQAQITKVLKVRKDQTTHLEMPYFIRYFTLNRLFADECEAISGRGGSALKNIVHDHIKNFIGIVAESEKQRLIQTMDADKWEAKDFSDQHRQQLDSIINSATKDIDPWTRMTWLWSEEDASQEITKGPAVNGATEPNAKDKVRSAAIDEEKYILSVSSLALLDGIEVFERLLTGIPSMGTDISSSMLEYMKLFNSRSSQLILGAGATRSAGLKHITTKHLTLSSQGLSFVAAIIPYIREFARRHLPSSSALMGDFDKVKRLYQDHQLGIQDKLVDIMTNRSSSLVSTMKKIDWDASSESETAVGGYMETLMKDTVTLQRVLTRHLPDTSVQMIMGPVISGYRDQWFKAFGGAVLKTPAGKERLLRDAEFFRARISKVDGAGDVGDSIYSIARARPVEPPATEKSEATSSESGNSKDGENPADSVGKE